MPRHASPDTTGETALLIGLSAANTHNSHGPKPSRTPEDHGQPRLFHRVLDPASARNGDDVPEEPDGVSADVKDQEQAPEQPHAIDIPRLPADHRQDTQDPTTANAKVQGADVRALHVLPPAPVKCIPATTIADPALQPTAPAAPVQRCTPPDGYRRALTAHRGAAPPRQEDPAIAEAVERQTRAIRELSARTFPEPDDIHALGPVVSRDLDQAGNRIKFLLHEEAVP